MHSKSPHRNGSYEAAAESEAARLALARLVAVAGHDLKQPLQIAMMSIARAVDEGVELRTAQRLRIASAALGRLGHELDDLARSSQSVELQHPHRQTVRLDELAEQLDADWRTIAETSCVDLRLRLPAISVESDPAMLMTILRNLVGNAIKYSRRDGRVLVGCRLRRDHVRVEVHDNGKGIAPERLGRIFDAFERGDAGDIATGLGLGLYIVSQTAELLQHPIAVRSTEGFGSAFSITLPLIARS